MASKHRDFQPDEASAQPSNLANNLFLVRADVIDFWRLALEHNWSIDKHYVLYPNPWPKKRQIKRRFHGHPVFFDMIRLAKYIELRSNWQIYAEEFAIALSVVAHQKIAAEEIKVVQHYFSPFEKNMPKAGTGFFASLQNSAYELGLQGLLCGESQYTLQAKSHVSRHARKAKSCGTSTNTQEDFNLHSL